MIPITLPRPEHPISRKRIDEEALKVLYRLHRHGFLAFLVGGSVRDLLLGRVPKDFDVATNAHPQEIRSLFKNSRIIGRRFRLVQIYFRGRKIVEVSTFRSRSEFEEIQTESGETLRTESFGTPPEDALRRDLTINGLFYNIADFSVIDYVGGKADLDRKIIRTIGDPDERFLQDPVRMIRAIRHAARTGFSIEEKTYQAIVRHREEIRRCSTSRVKDELLRDLKEGVAQPSLRLMLETGLLLSIFPDLGRVFGNQNPYSKKDQEYFLSLFDRVDELIREGRPVPDQILLALLILPFWQRVHCDHPCTGYRERFIYFLESIRWAIDQILTPYGIPRGIKEMVFQILVAQSALRKSVEKGMIPRRLRMKKYFDEAVLFWGIEAQAGGRKVPSLLRKAVPCGFLPWWPKESKRRR